jgi:hypothetical protein
MRGIRKIQTLERSRTPVIPNGTHENITHYKCGFRVAIRAARVHDEHSSSRNRIVVVDANLDADCTSDADFRLLCVADEHLEACAALFAFVDEILITPDAVLEQVTGGCSTRFTGFGKHK